MGKFEGLKKAAFRGSGVPHPTSRQDDGLHFTMHYEEIPFETR